MLLLDNLKGVNYIAVHYRFDVNDWMKHCKTAPETELKKVGENFKNSPFWLFWDNNYMQFSFEHENVKHSKISEYDLAVVC